MSLTDNKKKLLVWGIVSGLAAVMLALSGNPKNMAICIACFIRDIAGSVGLHKAAVVQYFRPEIVGIVLGAMILALINKEFKVVGGSSPIIRFFLGMIMIIGALVFLGCPTRMVIRMAAGDIPAWIGLIGFIGGVVTGSYFIRQGFSLGRSHKQPEAGGYVVPLLLVVGLIIAAFTTVLFASESGPGSMYAPLLISLIGGLVFGAIAQKTRMCFGGMFRDIALLKNFNLFSIVFGFFLTMLVYNIVTKNFSFQMNGNPIAHAQHLWNILGLYIVGFAAVLLGGCPLRQLILMGQGNTDSAITFVGMLLGAGLAHRASLASAAQTTEAAGGPGLNGKIATIVCIVILFAVAVWKSQRKVKYD
ncbi:MAG TPA: YedE-related selenium metabolism membrane protein [Tissierellia bacterium]|nr:YedE-related selenium metabolism membrane protein [Tissierellia bacterium]